MGTEYYLVKPSKQEIFYLGKRITVFNDIYPWYLQKEGSYPSWEIVDDVFIDLYENNKYFFDESMTFGEVWNICHALFDWCDLPVYLDNDCNDDNANTWKDWLESDSICHYLNNETLKGEELIEEIVTAKIPKEYWIVKDHIFYGTESLLNFIDKNKR